MNLGIGGPAKFPTFLSPDFLTCQMGVITSLSFGTMNVIGSVY